MRKRLQALIYCALVALAGVVGPLSGVDGQTKSQAKPPALTGVWRAGSTKIDVAVESWGEDCGPRPQSSSSAGGGIVNIEQVAGQLVIHGRGQDIRSDACWSRNPSMKRQSTGFTNNTWTTLCKTADADPREESGSYSLRITGSDTLTYQDVSRYNWALNTSRCVAKFTTIQTLTRGRNVRTPAVAETEPRPTKTVKPGVVSATPTVVAAPEPDEKACTPGSPRKLVLRPKRAEIEVGQRVCFRPRIVDASDCVIRDLPVEWSLTHSKALRGSLNNGCFSAAETAAEAEGEFKVVATVAGLKADAIVSVHPVDLSALIAKRLGGGALTGFDDSAPLDAAPRAVTKVATRHTPDQPTASPRKLVGIALGIAATALAFAALWLSRRKSPTPVPVDSAYMPLSATTTIELEAVEPDQDPTQDGVSDALRPNSARPAGDAWICPECRVGYPAHQQTCPKDGTALMPYAEFAQDQRKLTEGRKKQCPRCGQTFPTDAAFCSEDGTRLVDA